MRVVVSARGVALVVAMVVTAVATPASAQKKDIDELKVAVTELKTQLSELAAQAPTVGAAVQELSTRLGVIEQEIETLRREHTSFPDVVTTLDGLNVRVQTLERELEALRTTVADLQQPVAGPPSSGSAGYDKGFVFRTDDGRFGLKISGFLQARYELETAGDMSSVDDSGFRIRRGRFRLGGHIGHERFTYRLLTELFGSPKLQDYWMQYEVHKAFKVRAGQYRVPVTRTFLQSSTVFDFHERSSVIDNLRYERDVGVWVIGTVLDDKLRYMASATNGGGQNKVNDNIDLLFAGRGDFAVVGDLLKGYGDVENRSDPALNIGASVAHDLVRVPDTVAGVEVGNLDVDSDGVRDNVRVVTLSGDALFRMQGLEAGVEVIYRHESWGTILDSMDNQDLRDIIAPSADNNQTSFGYVGHASYFVMPKLLMVGARVSFGRLSNFSVGGRSLDSPTIGDELFELDALVQLYHAGSRLIGINYRFQDFGNEDGSEPTADDRAHIFTVESQLMF